MQQRQYERTPEQEKIEKRRQVRVKENMETKSKQV